MEGAKLPSGEVRKILKNAILVGTMGNADFRLIRRARPEEADARYSSSRQRQNMNPNDHPHGGGEVITRSETRSQTVYGAIEALNPQAAKWVINLWLNHVEIKALIPIVILSRAKNPSNATESFTAFRMTNGLEISN